MIVMHGFFDLKDGVNEGEFQRSFELFSAHLKELGMLVSWRFMQHQEHQGYNADPPTTRFYVLNEFTDMQQAEQCWDYVEKNDEPLKSLHSAVFSKIRNSSFFLASDI